MKESWDWPNRLQNTTRDVSPYVICRWLETFIFWQCEVMRTYRHKYLWWYAQEQEKPHHCTEDYVVNNSFAIKRELIENSDDRVKVDVYAECLSQLHIWFRNNEWKWLDEAYQILKDHFSKYVESYGE